MKGNYFPHKFLFWGREYHLFNVKRTYKRKKWQINMFCGINNSYERSSMKRKGPIDWFSFCFVGPKHLWVPKKTLSLSLPILSFISCIIGLPLQSGISRKLRSYPQSSLIITKISFYNINIFSFDCILCIASTLIKNVGFFLDLTMFRRLLHSKLFDIFAFAVNRWIDE